MTAGLPMKPLTENEAYEYLDFVNARIVGWSVALGIVDGRSDFRRKQTKQAMWLMLNLVGHVYSPGHERFMAAMVKGDDVLDLWPEAYREVVKFEVEHKIPREINEPMSDENMKERAVPDFLMCFSAEAVLENHPEWKHLAPSNPRPK